jgi:hypothetical protein
VRTFNSTWPAPATYTNTGSRRRFGRRQDSRAKTSSPRLQRRDTKS